MMKKRLYISFYTTSEAMATEKVTKEYQIPGRLVPIPRNISAGCGMAFMTNIEHQNILYEILNQEDIEYEDFHIL